MHQPDSHYFTSYHEEPEMMDFWLENGFRHFGVYFFQYEISLIDETIFHVMPLRVRLADFVQSKSQRKIMSKNADLKVVIRDAFVDDEKESLFFEHSERFTDNRPTSLFDFLSEAPATIPCQTKEICLYQKDKLVAVSFLDLGKASTSSIYAMFDLNESKRSLGIYTMLLEIKLSAKLQKTYYYPGYGYHESSLYDYKKKFSALEFLDWEKGWKIVNGK